MGIYETRDLVFVAKVKNGFVPRVREEVFPALEALQTPKCPFANLPETRSSRWVKPKLVCQVLPRMDRCGAPEALHLCRYARRQEADARFSRNLVSPNWRLKTSIECDMPDNNPNETQAPPPYVQLTQMATAYWVSDIVHVAANLSLADHLAEGPKTADEPLVQQGLTHRPSTVS